MPEQRIFTTGDPEPGPEIDAVTDMDGDVWWRTGEGWRMIGGTRAVRWMVLLAFQPLTECHAVHEHTKGTAPC